MEHQGIEGIMICRNVKNALPDLLLDPQSVSADVRNHVEHCAECGKELASLQATMAVLDSWEAPEPSPFFDVRMAALLRQEKEAEPAGFFERLRARVLFGSNLHLRPVAAGALALLLLIGGGTYAGFMTSTPETAPISPAVRDLQSLDENAQVFQQLTSLDQDQSDDSGASQNNL
jgi:hypothetical protein